MAVASNKGNEMKRKHNKTIWHKKVTSFFNRKALESVGVK